jgi:hypothetical protein
VNDVARRALDVVGSASVFEVGADDRSAGLVKRGARVDAACADERWQGGGLGNRRLRAAASLRST